jgi:RNA polymerase sigma factor (sigma-70 family)
LVRRLGLPFHSPDLDDWMQDVWLRAYEERPRIPDAPSDSDARAKMRAWLWTLARNQSLNSAKKEQRFQKRAPVRLDAADSPSGGGGVIDPVAASRTPSSLLMWRSLFQRLWATLDETDRKIIELRFEGCKLAQIAEPLGMTSEGVRSRMQRIRERARPWIRDEDQSGSR